MKQNKMAIYYIIITIVAITICMSVIFIAISKIEYYRYHINTYKDRIKQMEKEKLYWQQIYDSLQNEYNKLSDITLKQKQQADSLYNAIKKKKDKLVMIHENNGSHNNDIDDIISLYTKFLDMAKGDSVKY